MSTFIWSLRTGQVNVLTTQVALLDRGVKLELIELAVVGCSRRANAAQVEAVGNASIILVRAEAHEQVGERLEPDRDAHVVDAGDRADREVLRRVTRPEEVERNAQLLALLDGRLGNLVATELVSDESIDALRVVSGLTKVSTSVAVTPTVPPAERAVPVEPVLFTVAFESYAEPRTSGRPVLSVCL